jgi:hypothetical protein
MYDGLPLEMAFSAVDLTMGKCKGGTFFFSFERKLGSVLEKINSVHFVLSRRKPEN